MSVLHMIRLDPDMARAMEWGAREKLLSPTGDDGYLWHALLKAAFGKFAPKPFRLVEPSGGRRPYLVGYTNATQDALCSHAATYADPAIAAALGLATLAIKSMPNSFARGRKLGFEVRVRPVVRQTKDGDRNRKREIDVFLQRAQARPDDEKPSRAKVYEDWLAERLLIGGAKLDEMIIVWLRRSVMTRRGRTRLIKAHGNKGGGPDACFEGILSVSDQEAFRALLARGVGRHRSFGFGMLLLKPPRS
jgi:CRISPR system Cascade subunit CasE